MDAPPRLYLVTLPAPIETFPSAPERVRKTLTASALLDFSALRSAIDRAGGVVVAEAGDYPVLVVRLPADGVATVAAAHGRVVEVPELAPPAAVAERVAVDGDSEGLSLGAPGWRP